MRLLFIATLAMLPGITNATTIDPLPTNWTGQFKGIPVERSNIGEWYETSVFDGGLFHWFEKHLEDGTVCTYGVNAETLKMLEIASCRSPSP